MSHRSLLAQVDLTPTAGGMPGAELWQTILNWAGQVGLWCCLGALIGGGAYMGLNHLAGNAYQASKGRLLVVGGGLGALIIGLAPVIVNTLFSQAN